MARGSHVKQGSVHWASGSAATPAITAGSQLDAGCSATDDGHGTAPGLRPTLPTAEQGNSCPRTNHLRQQIHRPGREIPQSGYVIVALEIPVIRLGLSRWLCPCISCAHRTTNLWHYTSCSQAHRGSERGDAHRGQEGGRHNGAHHIAMDLGREHITLFRRGYSKATPTLSTSSTPPGIGRVTVSTKSSSSWSFAPEAESST